MKFALLALFVAGAAAAPQVPLYQYAGYPIQYPQYAAQYHQQLYYPQVQQQLRYIPQYPLSYYPGGVSPLQAQTRSNQFGIDFAGFESRNADFVTDGATQVMMGNAEFRQNIFTGSSMDYTIFMDNDMANTLTLANKKFSIYISSDCTAAAGNKMTDITAPFFLINGFYAKGRTDGFNKDGSDGKMTIAGMKVVVTDAADSTMVRGCTAVLA